jgi:ABC-type polysaccharide/polyol phosphate export permease
VKSNFFKDFLLSLQSYDQPLYMAWWDIRSKYRRTMLGPFWMVIVTFISIICMSVLGSLLFKINLKDFFPYIASGMIIWAFLSVLIIEACTIFITYSWMISNLNFNPITLCIRMFIRNFIVFLHGLVVVAAILIFKGTLTISGVMIASFGLLIYFINAICLCVVLGFFSTRYRDCVQIVQSIMSILIFMTPIMWQKHMLGDKQFLAELNPFTHFIDIIRAPLLSMEISNISILYVAIVTMLNVACASYLYRKFKHRLVFWL